jgi:hypothetical protein
MEQATPRWVSTTLKGKERHASAGPTDTDDEAARAVAVKILNLARAEQERLVLPGLRFWPTVSLRRSREINSSRIYIVVN